VFDSCVVVKKDAQKTKTIQKNNNILLSSRSTVNTNPQLEIFADDVECAHGSTIGEIDEAALFYLKTRGLSKKTATNLLLSAFVNDVTKMISEKNIKKELTSDLNKQLNLSF
jgi:Fe-S cluster assembly protein SufD